MTITTRMKLCRLGSDPRGKLHVLEADGRTRCEHMTTGTWSRQHCAITPVARRGKPTCNWCLR